MGSGEHTCSNKCYTLHTRSLSDQVTGVVATSDLCLYGAVVILEIFLICRPLAVDWKTRLDGKCGDQVRSYVALEILGLLIDINLALPPSMEDGYNDEI